MKTKTCKCGREFQATTLNKVFCGSISSKSGCTWARHKESTARFRKRNPVYYKQHRPPKQGKDYADYLKIAVSLPKSHPGSLPKYYLKHAITL
jgi:hypothetical protein